MALSLRRARTIIRKTLEAGREMELKPLSVVVLDAGGHVIAFEREDGASPGRFAIAQGKAYGAVMLGMPGSAQMAFSSATDEIHSPPLLIRSLERSRSSM